MKKFLVLLLAVIMLITATACVKIVESAKDNDDVNKEASDTSTDDDNEDLELVGTWIAEVHFNDIIEAANDSENAENTASIFMMADININQPIKYVIEFTNETDGAFHIDEESALAFLDELVPEIIDLYSNPEFVEATMGITYEEFEIELKKQGMTIEEYKEAVAAQVSSTMTEETIKENMDLEETSFTYTVEDDIIKLSGLETEDMADTLTINDNKLEMKMTETEYTLVFDKVE